MKGYDTVAYAKSRLYDTMIRCKGQPVWVVGAGGKDSEIILEVKNVSDGHVYVVMLKDCDLDPVPLGYINFDGAATYVMRAPMRRDWKQGLRTLNMVDPNGNNVRGIRWERVVSTILNKFPTFDKCLEVVNSPLTGIVSRAYARDFSVRKETLEYKGLLEVGFINSDNGSVTLKNNMSWVREAFDISMEKAA